ncbi:MAG: GNAT family N-acetyltransferase [Bacteroidota bacterium]
MPSEIKIRQATANDLPEILNLFAETIQQIAKRDYNTAQIEVWASSVQNQTGWEKAINDQYFLVATLENIIVGFGSLDESGYLDFLYVHKDYQREGIAKTIYQVLEEEAIRKGHTRITTDASKTAKGFFIHQGFEVIKENLKLVKGVEITNYRMAKAL